MTDEETVDPRVEAFDDCPLDGEVIGHGLHLEIV